MNLSTKAKNLILLKKLNLVNSKIPIFLKYSVEELKLSQNTIIRNIQSNLSKKIIIRSSFFLEDSKKFSMAGEFEGSSNIKNNKKNIKNAIKKILVQYKKKSKKKSHYLQSEIIFQNYISKSIFSGVLTNFCIKDGSNYFVVNYDDVSGSTDTVTSGSKIGERVINKLLSLAYKKEIRLIETATAIAKSLPENIRLAAEKKEIEAHYNKVVCNDPERKNIMNQVKNILDLICEKPVPEDNKKWCRMITNKVTEHKKKKDEMIKEVVDDFKRWHGDDPDL